MSYPGFAVDTVGFHCSPHFDEAVGYDNAQKYGREKYPGIERATFRFFSSKRQLPSTRVIEEWMQRNRTLLFGLGRGRYDEHGMLRSTESCASLVAKDLGVATQPKLAELLAYTSRTDQEANQTSFSLPKILKTVHKLYPDQPIEVMQWMSQAVHEQAAEESDKAEQEVDLDFAFASYLLRHANHYGAANRSTITTLEKEIRNSHGPISGSEFAQVLKERTSSEVGEYENMIYPNSTMPLGSLATLLVSRVLKLDTHSYIQRPLLEFVRSLEGKKLDTKFELDAAIRNISRSSGRSDALAFADVALAAKINEQTLFQECPAIAATAQRFCRDGLWLAAVKTENPMLMKYIRSNRSRRKKNHYADVLIQQRTSGHTSVFTNNEEVNMERIVSLLRCAEGVKRGHFVKAEDQTSEQCPFGVFYFYKPNRAILNGSDSFPQEWTTRLSLEEVIRLVLRGMK